MSLSVDDYWWWDSLKWIFKNIRENHNNFPPLVVDGQTDVNFIGGKNTHEFKNISKVVLAFKPKKYIFYCKRPFVSFH